VRVQGVAPQEARFCQEALSPKFTCRTQDGADIRYVLVTVMVTGCPVVAVDGAAVIVTAEAVPCDKQKMNRTEKKTYKKRMVCCMENLLPGRRC